MKEKIAAELVSIAKSLIAEPMTFDAPRVETIRWAKRTLMVALRVDSSWRQIYESFMTVRDGTSNKFHYFGVFQSRSGEAVGGNAYGRIGYTPKAIEVFRGSVAGVLLEVRTKAHAKLNKGYRITEV